MVSYVKWVCLKVPEFDKDLKYSSDETMSCSCLNILTTWDSGTGQGFEIGFVVRTNGVGDLRGFNNKEQPFLKFIAMFRWKKKKGLNFVTILNWNKNNIIQK